MDNILSLSTSRIPYAPIPLTKTHHLATSATSVSFSLKPQPPPTPPPPDSQNSSNLRRPESLKPTGKKIPSNPLKNLVRTNYVPPPPSPSVTDSSYSLSSKLRLSSKLSPPPPPPPPLPPSLRETQVEENQIPSSGSSSSKEIDFRQEGKIFIGNLPNWIKKNELAEFFRQFGPIKNVILIKGHNDIEKNMGFGFVIYGGPAAEKSAMKAVEFDGVEFHGRVLTVKLDDGRRLKTKAEERARWVEGVKEEEYRSTWHKEREGGRMEFRKVVETQPENWQAVVAAFERVKKVY